MRQIILGAAGAGVLVTIATLGYVSGGAQAQPPAVTAAAPVQARVAANVGVRPFYLVDDMDAGALKDKLKQCAAGPFYRTDFSIGHRGAGLQFPEHTRESYTAAARMGAGIVECDATFTKDRQLVCRHDQCDLHTTTDVLSRPELAAKCTTPFKAAADGKPAEAMCCTSDFTLSEFKQLKGKMDAFNPNAKTVKEYQNATPIFRTDLYASTGTLMTHAESIELFKQLGVKFTPELKAPRVAMPFQGTYTQDMYAQQLLDEYKKAGVDPKNVFPQSFLLRDVLYWIKNEPAFGAQGVYLDDRVDGGATTGFDQNKPETWKPSMKELVDQGVKIIAPPTTVLVGLDANKKIVPSAYAKAAKDAGLKIITWTLERSGTLTDGGGYYYDSIKTVTNNSGDTYNLLDVLAKDVGVIGVFSDWPGTVTYYANCMGLK